ncbi:MAG TPA: pyridoxamine 5'-phosphate oxidase family protein [Candidatus Dormibacteraeota bacterium]|nr:pyridoxamine 5'-phosphate oxidase family protein [Candidatus Dormibacteraeota bacterium]
MARAPIRTMRPYMPGYGTKPASQGSGLLPWSWAEERLISSRNYWMVSVWPDGSRPHAMPVWGMWHDLAFWFSSSLPSRKAKNLSAHRRCVVTTEDASNPVVVEGTAQLLTDPKHLELLLSLENAKYETDYKIDLLDPAVNSSFRVRPRWAFGIANGDFEGSPTRWEFEA